jgi:hypothetical protein
MHGPAKLIPKKTTPLSGVIIGDKEGEGQVTGGAAFPLIKSRAAYGRRPPARFHLGTSPYRKLGRHKNHNHPHKQMRVVYSLLSRLPD